MGVTNPPTGPVDGKEAPCRGPSCSERMGLPDELLEKLCVAQDAQRKHLRRVLDLRATSAASERRGKVLQCKRDAIKQQVALSAEKYADTQSELARLKSSNKALQDTKESLEAELRRMARLEHELQQQQRPGGANKLVGFNDGLTMVFQQPGDRSKQAMHRRNGSLREHTGMYEHSSIVGQPMWSCCGGQRWDSEGCGTRSLPPQPSCLVSNLVSAPRLRPDSSHGKLSHHTHHTPSSNQQPEPCAQQTREAYPPMLGTVNLIRQRRTSPPPTSTSDIGTSTSTTRIRQRPSTATSHRGTATDHGLLHGGGGSVKRPSTAEAPASRKWQVTAIKSVTRKPVTLTPQPLNYLRRKRPGTAVDSRSKRLVDRPELVRPSTSPVQYQHQTRVSYSTDLHRTSVVVGAHTNGAGSEEISHSLGESARRLRPMSAVGKVVIVRET